MADPSTSPPLTRPSVAEAAALIRPLVHRTPVLRNATLTALASRRRDPAELAGTVWEYATPAPTPTPTPTEKGDEKKEKGEKREPANPKIRLWFKCENLQRVGAFKARGAFHALERLKREPGWVEGGGRERGVVTHSSGGFSFSFSFSFSFLMCYLYLFFWAFRSFFSFSFPFRPLSLLYCSLFTYLLAHHLSPPLLLPSPTYHAHITYLRILNLNPLFSYDMHTITHPLTQKPSR